MELSFYGGFWMKENGEIKEDFEFFKGITEKLGIALHVNEIIDRKYFKTLWGNKMYVEILGKSIEDRNKNIKKSHEEFSLKNDPSVVKEFLQATSEKNESYSLLYKHPKPEGTDHWLLSIIKPFNSERKKELKHLVCASFDMVIEDSHLQQYENLQKEIAQLKNNLIISELSKKETEILQLLTSGKTENEIATILSRSMHTVKTHLKNIRKKLKLKKSTELVKFALESGIA